MPARISVDIPAGINYDVQGETGIGGSVAFIMTIGTALYRKNNQKEKGEI